MIRILILTLAFKKIKMNKYIILSKQKFTALYRFGQVPIMGSRVITTGKEDENFRFELFENFKSIAFFNGDEEYLIIKFDNKEGFQNINIRDVIEIIPLTTAAKKSYELKFNRRIQFSEARFEDLTYKIEEYIDLVERIKGVPTILEILLPPHLRKIVVSDNIIEKAYIARVQSKKSSEIKENFLTHLLIYDRYNFFPNTNLGYFYDVGELYAHSKGHATFKGSGFHTFLEKYKNELNDKKLLEIIQFIEQSTEIEAFKTQLTEKNLKRYISAVFYLKFKSDLLEKDSIGETDLKKFTAWIINQNKFTSELVEAINLLGAFFGYQKIYDDYYEVANLRFFKPQEIIKVKKELSKAEKPILEKIDSEKSVIENDILNKIKNLLGNKVKKVETKVKDELYLIIKPLIKPLKKPKRISDALDLMENKFGDYIIVDKKKKTLKVKTK